MERFRIEQAKQAKQQNLKKRKIEVNEDSSSTESEDDDYMEELAEKVKSDTLDSVEYLF